MKSRPALLVQQAAFENHVVEVKACRTCPRMVGPVVCAEPIISPAILVGQAPGPREGEFGKPFAWTAGKTMFRWFSSIGLDEEEFRRRVFIAAVCKCFPGKNPKGGDRVPDSEEILNCSRWLDQEMRILKPKLVISVGKLAASQFLEFSKLNEIVGQVFALENEHTHFDLVCLPHPSGASTWHRTEPGVTLLKQALQLIGRHRVWREILQ